MRQFIDCLRLMHHFQHQSATRLRRDGEHPLRFLERQRYLAIEGLTSIGAASSLSD